MNIQIHILIYAHIYIYIYTYNYRHVYVYIYIYAYIHTVNMGQSTSSGNLMNCSEHQGSMTINIQGLDRTRYKNSQKLSFKYGLDSTYP